MQNLNREYEQCEAIYRCRSKMNQDMKDNAAHINTFIQNLASLDQMST